MGAPGDPLPEIADTVFDAFHGALDSGDGRLQRVEFRGAAEEAEEGAGDHVGNQLAGQEAADGDDVVEVPAG